MTSTDCLILSMWNSYIWKDSLCIETGLSYSGSHSTALSLVNQTKANFINFLAYPVYYIDLNWSESEGTLLTSIGRSCQAAPWRSIQSASQYNSMYEKLCTQFMLCFVLFMQDCICDDKCIWRQDLFQQVVFIKAK